MVAPASVPLRITPLGMFVAAFVLLASAAGAAAIAQFMASPEAPWVSMVYSAGAIVATVTAVVLGRARRRG